MAAAGWYADPSGAPGFRWWDGVAWAADTAPSPHAPPPPGAAPPPQAAPPAQPASPPPPGPPTWAPAPAAPRPQADRWPGSPGHAGGWAGPPPPPQPTGPPPGPPRRTRSVLLVVGAVVAVVAIAAASFLVVRGLVGDDDPGTAAGTTTTSPTDAPTEGGTDGGTQGGTEGGRPAQCDRGQPTIDGNQRRGRTFSGGGLSMPTVDGYRQVDAAGAQYTFADGVVATVSVVEQTDDVGWVSMYALGGLNRDNEFGSPEAAARTVLACLENSDFYSSITDSSEVDAVDTTIDGADAYVLTQQIDVDEPELSVTGDIAQIAVVDTGDEETYGLYVGIVPIGDRDRLQQQATQLMSLRVD